MKIKGICKKCREKGPNKCKAPSIIAILNQRGMKRKQTRNYFSYGQNQDNNSSRNKLKSLRSDHQSLFLSFMSRVSLRIGKDLNREIQSEVPNCTTTSTEIMMLQETNLSRGLSMKQVSDLFKEDLGYFG